MEQVKNFDDTIFAENVIGENDVIKFPRDHHRNGSSSTEPKSKTKKKVSKVYEDFDFDLFGDTFHVHFQDQVFSKENNNYWVFGHSNYANLEISLSTKRQNGMPLLHQQIKQTFIHEVVHMILESGQFYDESYNEALVEWIAKCINQMCPTIMDKFK